MSHQCEHCEESRKPQISAPQRGARCFSAPLQLYITAPQAGAQGSAELHTVPSTAIGATLTADSEGHLRATVLRPVGHGQ